MKILVLGIQRSGNHCIINWLGTGMKDNVVLWNNVNANLYTLDRPFVKYRGKNKVINKIYTVENFDLRYFDAVYEGMFDRIMLVLRDPFNLSASIAVNNKEKLYNFKQRGYKYNSHIGFRNQSFVNLIKQYLKQGTKQNLNWDVISYNRFVSDSYYRENLARKLGIADASETLNRIPSVGNGSSFDDFRYNGKAREMDVLNRWKHYINEAWYRKLFDDELIELSEEMFPEIGNPLNINVQ